MNWKKRIVECLTEAQFRRGMSSKEGKKRGQEAEEGTASEKERRAAFKTHPGKRTKAQQRTQRGSRRRYQRTGKTPFKTGRAMSTERNIEKAGLGPAPHTRASKRTRGVSSHGKKRN